MPILFTDNFNKLNLRNWCLSPGGVIVPPGSGTIIANFEDGGVGGFALQNGTELPINVSTEKHSGTKSLMLRTPNGTGSYWESPYVVPSGKRVKAWLYRHSTRSGAGFYSQFYTVNGTGGLVAGVTPSDYRGSLNTWYQVDLGVSAENSVNVRVAIGPDGADGCAPGDYVLIDDITYE